MSWRAELAFQDAEDWWASLWTHGSRIALEAMTDDELARFKRDCFER